MFFNVPSVLIVFQGEYSVQLCSWDSEQCELMDDVVLSSMSDLTHKAPNTTIAEVANTVDPDEMAHNDDRAISSGSTVFAL